MASAGTYPRWPRLYHHQHSVYSLDTPEMVSPGPQAYPRWQSVRGEVVYIPSSNIRSARANDTPSRSIRRRVPSPCAEQTGHQ